VLSDVAAVVRELRNELEDNGRDAFICGRTAFGQFLDEWLKLTWEKREEKTNIDYEDMIRLYVKPYLGKIPLEDLSSMEIQRGYSRMTARGLSPKTVRNVHVIVMGSLNQAVKWGKIRKNPCLGVELPKRAHREMQYLDREQAKAFVKACREQESRLVLWFALWTGMRPEEYMAVQWKDVDFDRGEVKVRRKVQHREKGGGWYVGELKTAKSRRVIPLDEDLETELRRHRIRQRERIQDRFEKKERYEQHGFVFASEVGTPWRVRNLQRRVFKPLLQKLKLPDIRLYDLRHTCATLLLSNGVDVKTVSEWLGHANAAETLNTYAHVMPSAKKEAATGFGKVLRG
jgi:integrase